MWTCPLCSQTFVNTNQVHSCNDRSLDDCLKGKSAHTISLLDHFISEYRQMGDISIHPTKTMISMAMRVRFAYIVRLGKDYIEVSFPFRQAYPDNLCFYRIAQVPGQQQFNHYFRMYAKDDLNEELREYMKLALEGAK